VVRKTREAWLIDNTRIHLDWVERLGRFIEFEAAVCDKYSARECVRIVAHLRDLFAPAMGEPIASSYSDLADEDSD
jgi:adenylate cyclase class IV